MSIIRCTHDHTTHSNIVVYSPSRGALHYSFRGLHHWHLNSIIGGKCQDCLTSLYTRAQEHKRQRKFEWMERLHGNLWDTKWISIYGLLGFASSPFQMGGTNTKSGDHDMSKSHFPWFIVVCYVERATQIGWYVDNIGLRAHSCMYVQWTQRPMIAQNQFSIFLGTTSLSFKGPPQFHGHWPFYQSIKWSLI